MTREAYDMWRTRMEKIPNASKILERATKLITDITAGFYIGVLIMCALDLDFRKISVMIAVPALSFAIVSIFREKCNVRRPYEVYQFTPLIQKDTKGKSFPSRHVFSIYVIGTTICFYEFWFGFGLCLLGVILAFLRVVSGVHFPKDVIAGGVAGVFFGCIAGVIMQYV